VLGDGLDITGVSHYRRVFLEGFKQRHVYLLIIEAAIA
jgi:hypothetical protein